MKIGLDLAEILRISKLDWRDGGGKKEGGREGGKALSEYALSGYTRRVRYSYSFGRPHTAPDIREYRLEPSIRLVPNIPNIRLLPNIR